MDKKTVVYSIYMIEDYSAIREKKVTSLAGKWMELETIVSNKVHQSQKAKLHVFSYVSHIILNKIKER